MSATALIVNRVQPRFATDEQLAALTSALEELPTGDGARAPLRDLIDNLTGYTLGYWGARLLGSLAPGARMTEADCRTVAIEVGMQNGGMATGIAMEVLRSPVAALPPGVFGTTMNITGSLLANYWKRRPPVLSGEPCQEKAEVHCKPHG